MRLALTFALVASFTGTLTACGTQQGPAGPERRSAAGEVLGGDASDEMLPIDTVRSTSPAGSSAPGAEPGDRAKAPEERRSAEPTPPPTLEAAPMPDMTMPADPEPLRTPEG